MNRDPIEEAGGENLYSFCGNNALSQHDFLGRETRKRDPFPTSDDRTVAVPVTFKAWCVRKRNNLKVDIPALILSTGYWGSFEVVQLEMAGVGEISAPCAGGILFFRMYPHIGYPPNVGEPAKIPSGPENPLGRSFVGGSVNFPLPNATMLSSADLFGPPVAAGNDGTILYPNAYPRYDYPSARFNIGRKWRVMDISGNLTIDFEQTELWRSWNTIFHQPNNSDGSLSIHVDCGDLVEVEMGNVGKYEFKHKYRATKYRSSGWRGSD
jgi:hypothetical protein